MNIKVVAFTVSEKSHNKLTYFRENFIFENSVKRHICHVKNSRLGHDLPTSVDYRVISPFREGYIFMSRK